MEFKNYEKFNEAKEKCRECYIGQVYNRVVLSDGCKSKPTVMILGEAPGADEIEEGRPFVGRAGKLLRATLNQFGFRKKNSLISNVIACRPEKNKFPKDRSIVLDCVNKWLMEEIRLTQPKYLLLLGNQPLFYILGMTGITKTRGEWIDLRVCDHGIRCMPTFHPSYVLRKAHMKDGKQIISQFENDIKTIAERAKFI